MAKGNTRIIDPREWLSDMVLRQCSLSARGLAVDLLSLMSQGEPCGTLTFPAERITSVLCVAELEYAAALAELERFGVFRRTDAGLLYSPRLSEDAQRRAVNASNGRRGGNPSLKAGVNQFHEIG